MAQDRLSAPRAEAPAKGVCKNGTLTNGTNGTRVNGTMSPPPSPGSVGRASTSPAHIVPDAISNGINGSAGLGIMDETSNFRSAVINSGTQTPDPDEGEPIFGQQRRESHRLPAYETHQTDNGGPSSHSRAHIRSYADDERVQLFPRLSKPVELLGPAYDYVVIGSGYGGAIAASRMARTPGTVCVLERGREKWPGQYPVSTLDSLKELHVSGEISPTFLPGKTVQKGDPTGMYHLIFGKGQNAVVCNGLGGTSLMNGNVFMEADKAALEMKQWPLEIRKDGLDKYYKMVEDVLEPTEYPDDWPKLPKMELLKKQAEMIGFGDKFRKVRQTTRFHNGPNSCGVEMSSSALTGQDTTGVNDGSKNTTLVTYLADAWNSGAEMFCECEVRYIEKVDDREGGGYIVYFAWHGRNRGAFKANLHGDLMWVRAKQAVFLGAGAIGTTEILLRSKEVGLKMSPMVGQNMSGNGDILAFGYNTDEQVNGIGCQFPSPYNPVGPTINGVIDCRDGHENPLDGFVIEEGAVPHALARLFQSMLEFMPGSVEPTGENVVDRAKASLASWGSRLLGPYLKSGAIERTQVYLIMSHDSNQAVLSLVDDKPVLEFLGVGRSDHVKKLNEILARATQVVGGTLVNNPFFAIDKQQVTVHPIGGACMAHDNTGRTGVTNHAGLLFKGRGKETYEGIVVTDGAVIPTALGANPFATIAALAERSVEHYVQSKKLEVRQGPNGLLDLFGEPKFTKSKLSKPKFSQTTSGSASQQYSQLEQSQLELSQLEESLLEESRLDEFESSSIKSADLEIAKAHAVHAAGFGFTEVMSGFIHRDKNMVEDRIPTYELAARTAKAQCESARFFLSVQAFNTHNVVHKADHRAMLTGTFVCPTLPGSPFMVARGEFNLFIADQKAPGTRNLTYDFHMRGVNNKRLHFHGYKVVDSSVALSPLQFWKATSTLYVTITECHSDLCDTPHGLRRGNVLAKGMMNIQPGDFLSEILTLTPTGSSLLQKVSSAASFLTFFTRKSLSLFLAPLTPLQYPRHAYTGYINKKTKPDDSFAIYAKDGVCTRMHMWEPTQFHEQQRDLFMVPGVSADHQMFATPTIPFNAVNYFCRAGYRVWVSVHRIGQLMVAANDWTTYDVRLDLRACLEYIRKKQGIKKRDLSKTPPENKIYVMAHCMGSVALASGLLDGTIPSDWLAGISASQVFMNPIWSTLNMAKALAGPVPLDRLYRAAAGDWFSVKTSTNDSLVQRAINQLLRLYPDHRRELCNNACCHRMSFAFGRCWNHGNLNEATHRQLDRFFGGVNMTCMHLLMRMGSHGAVMRNGPLFEPLPTPENVRARLGGVPVFLWVGADNAVLSPRSTEQSYEVLCDTFGGLLHYKRRVVPGYGHLDGWIGRNAWRDVYPMLLEEMDAVVRGPGYKFQEPNDEFKKMVDKRERLGGELV